jgi:hypothetical protein
MADDRKSVREGAAKIAGFIAADVDASFGTIANPELIALGMVANLGAPPDTELGRSLEDAQQKGVVRVANKPVDENAPALVAARKKGNLAGVIRARRELESASRQREQAAEPGKPRRPLQEIYDFSSYDDDEIGLIDTNTLTSSSREAYIEELDQRMAGAGSYAEAQAWEVQEGEDVQTFDIDDDDPWEGDAV